MERNQGCMRKRILKTFLGVLLAFGPGPLLNAEGEEKASPAKTPEALYFQGTVGQKYEWHKSAKADGITIYWCRVGDSPVIAFRGEGIVDGPIEKVSSVIVDTTRATEWVDSLVSSKVLRPVSPMEFIEYDHVGIPFPFTPLMSDRDFVSKATLAADPKTHGISVTYESVDDPSMPPLKKYVRGVMWCEFKMTPMSFPGQTYVEAEIHCDPKGSIAKWLVNF